MDHSIVRMSSHVLLILVQATLQVLSLTEECDFTHDGICYKFLREKSTYDSASIHCYDNNGDPAKIDSEDVADAAAVAAEQIGISRFWIGAELDDTLGWRWTQDSKPLAYQGCYSGSNEILNLKYDGVDNPARCMTICANNGKEYAGLTMDSSSQTICSCGTSSAFQRMSKVNEDDCNHTCDEPNLDGFHGNCGGETAWAVYYVNGSLFFDWPEDLATGNGDCVTLTEKGWKYRPCHSRRAHICQYDYVRRDCQQFANHVWLGNVCVTLHTDSETWHAARYNCIEHGGDLLYVPMFSNNYASALIARWIAGSGEEWWIGLTNRQWLWSIDFDDLSRYPDLWLRNHPVYEAHPRKTCLSGKKVTMSRKQSMRWVEQDCMEELPVLCQIDYFPSGDSGDWVTNDYATWSWTWTKTEPEFDVTTASQYWSTDPSRPVSPSGPSDRPNPSERITTTQAAEQGQKSTTQEKAFVIGVGVGVGGAVLIIIIIISVCACRRCRNRSSAAQRMSALPPGAANNKEKLKNGAATNGHHKHQQMLHNASNPTYDNVIVPDSGVYETLNETGVNPGPEYRDLSPKHHSQAYENMPEYMEIDPEASPQRPLPSAPSVSDGYLNASSADGVPGKNGRLVSTSSGEIRTYDSTYLTLQDDTVQL